MGDVVFTGSNGPPAVPAGGATLLATDASGRLIVVSGGGGGVAYPQGQLAPIAAATLAQILNVLATGRYNAAGVVLADGQGAEAQLTSGGFSKGAEQFAPVAEDNTNGVIASIPRPTSNGAYSPSVASLVNSSALFVKGTPGVLLSASGTNATAATTYLFIKNKAGPIAAADVPDFSFAVPAGTSLSVGRDFFGLAGFKCSLGIAIGLSTTRAAFAAAAGASCDMFATYV